MLDSLLGPALADPALDLRAIILLGGDDALALLVAAATGESAGDDRDVECLGSVGVGGVFTMTGAPGSPVGGVRGGREVSMLCPLERRRNRADGVVLATSWSWTD